MDQRLPGAFAGETVTRRRFMTGTAYAAGAVAASAVALPAIGFALGPGFERQPVMWQPVGPAGDFTDTTYVPRVIRLTTDPIGEAARSIAFVRRRNPEIDTEPLDEWNRFVAISTRCAHIGCPVNYFDASRSFVCPCHGGVYDFRGIRIGGPPPRPLDRFLTRVRAGELEIGPRFSVNNELERFSPRDPGEALDGLGRFLYPARPSTAPLPKG
ncbi:ubiquinol-cytochrome c reductase iron-sulfur subunit [Solirubrobacter soli]|uniref:QcrA and Rieske domain-containing protein n=1 Tax=Solirubrobacter soli TaxID=363832 RepID=UPI00041F52C8|nr:Rieske (2Fe-2S) protein [Solirubrobacter soli]